MPYASKAQARFMNARHPGLAKEFNKKTNDFGSLPQKVGNSNPNATRKAAIQRRLGNAPSPGPKSQSKGRQKVSPQVSNVVKQQMFKKQLSQAKESNLSQRQLNNQKKSMMRQTALQRRQANKK